MCSASFYDRTADHQAAITSDNTIQIWRNVNITVKYVCPELALYYGESDAP